MAQDDPVLIFAAAAQPVDDPGGHGAAAGRL
jgi:hypothetical protein